MAKQTRQNKRTGNVTDVKNFLGNTPLVSTVNNNDIRASIFREQVNRIRQNVGTWRDGIKEAENAYYPSRVKMQTLYLDTVLNGHVAACMSKRKSLTLSKKFTFVKPDGSEIPAPFLEESWFDDFLSQALDAKFYGYTLLTIGDIDKGKLTGVNLVRRANVSPDRFIVSSHVNGLTGPNFMDETWAPWTIYIPTPTETGTSPCGYGILYKVGIYEIYLRNLLGFNGDFVELFAQPYRVASTTKTEGAERDLLEEAVKNMGSAGYIIKDPDDMIEFLSSNLGGTGYNGYDNLEKRCEAKISKLILGHADALDSTPGKLGADQGEESPVNQALEYIENEDSTFAERLVNNVLIPKLRNLGVKIPEGVFKFSNNKEAEEYRRRVDQSNKVTAEIAQILSTAGLAMDPEYFSERTGIPVTVIQKVTPPTPESQALTAEIQNKLKTWYKIK